MDRNQKKDAVAALKQQFEGATTVIVTHYIGLSVEEITKLRQKIQELGASFKVTKNRLAKIALKDTEYEQLADLFVGPTAVAFSKDPVAAAKAVVEFAKLNDKLVIVGGAIQNNKMSLEKIDALAKLASLDELRAKIVGMIKTPATRIASVLQAPGGQVARVLNAHSQQG